MAAFRYLQPGGICVTDCKAVYKTWRQAVRDLRPQEGSRGSQFWPAMRAAHQGNPTAQIQWMPAHKSAEVLATRGYPQLWRDGNDAADHAAKLVAQSARPPEGLVRRYRLHCDHELRIARTAAHVLLDRLKKRVRSTAGFAIKFRKRRTVALPRRLRKVQKVDLLARPLPKAQPVVGLRDALRPSARAHWNIDLIPGQVISQPPVQGLHHFLPDGDWPARGSRPPVQGRLRGSWMCQRCNCRVSDSSRLLGKLRTPCGEGLLVTFGEATSHELVEHGDGYVCSACGLLVDVGHRHGAAAAKCPVLPCMRAGEPFLEGRQSLAVEMAKVALFRLWCEPVKQYRQAAGEAARAHAVRVPQRPFPAANPALLPPYRTHSCFRGARHQWCVQCLATDPLEEGRCHGRARADVRVPDGLLRAARSARGRGVALPRRLTALLHEADAARRAPRRAGVARCSTEATVAEQS